MAAPIGPKKVRRYTVEFKIQAVRLSLHPDIQTQDVANALDIHPFMLSTLTATPDSAPHRERRAASTAALAHDSTPRQPSLSGGGTICP